MQSPVRPEHVGTTPQGDESTRTLGRDSRRIRRLGGPWLVVAAWMAALAVVRAGFVEESDPYWQIRAGVETLRGATLSRPDQWSWAPVGTPFTQTSPGWNLLLGAAWTTAGFPGFFLVSLTAIGLLFMAMVLLARQLGAGPTSTLAGLLITLLLALPFLSPRATVGAQALFLGAIAVANWWRRDPHALPLWLSSSLVGIAAAAIAWAGSWLHLSWLLLAPAMTLAWAVLWAATPQLSPRRIVSWSMAGPIGASLGLLAGPYGTEAWDLSKNVHEACAGLVTEWLGMFTPGLAARWAGPGLVAIGLTVMALMWVIRHWSTRGRDPRVGLVGALTVIAVPASLGGLSAIRFIGVSLLSLSPVAAMGAAHIAARLRRRLTQEPRGLLKSERVRFWADGRHWRPILVALPIVLLPGIVLMALPLGRPLHEMAVIKLLPEGCHLVSDPGSAASVILLRPDVKVWVDGRADYYGRQRNLDAIKLLRSSTSYEPPLDRATCVMLRRDDRFDVEPLVAALDADAGWQRLGPDGSVAAWSRR